MGPFLFLLHFPECYLSEPRDPEGHNMYSYILYLQLANLLLFSCIPGLDEIDEDREEFSSSNNDFVNLDDFGDTLLTMRHSKCLLTMCATAPFPTRRHTRAPNSTQSGSDPSHRPHTDFNESVPDASCEVHRVSCPLQTEKDLRHERGPDVSAPAVRYHVSPPPEQSTRRCRICPHTNRHR